MSDTEKTLWEALREGNAKWHCKASVEIIFGLTKTMTVWKALIVFFFLREVLSATKVERSLTIQNDSGHRVALNWIHPDTKETSLISDPDILTGADFVVDSFVSHEFEVRELPARKTGECETPGNCKVVFFTVNDNAEQRE